jgi:hypothetical protein
LVSATIEKRTAVPADNPGTDAGPGGLNHSLQLMQRTNPSKTSGSVFTPPHLGQRYWVFMSFILVTD